MGGHQGDVREDVANDDTIARASSVTAGASSVTPAEPARPQLSARPPLPPQSLESAPVPATGSDDGAGGHAREVPPTAATQPAGSVPPAPTARLIDRVPAALFASDTVALVVAVLAAGVPLAPAMVHVVVTLAVLVGRLLHRPRLTLSLADDAPALTGALVIGLAASSMVNAIVGDMADWNSLFLLGVTTVTAVLGLRALAHMVIRYARRRGWANHRALIVGTDPLARRLARMMQRDPELGLRFAGFLGPSGTASQEMFDSLVGHDATQLARLCRRQDISVVIVTSAGRDDEVLTGIRWWGPSGGPTVYVAPRLHALMHSASPDRIRDVALFRVRPTAAHVLAWRVKSLLDRFVAGFLLVLVSPILALVALAVRLETGPGVLFRQTRIGRGGEPFTLLKFRSMRPAKAGDSARRWSIADSSRMGPVGRFIRKASLDELPQLFNILRGDMSLVGPRPERPHFVDQFTDKYDGYELRHRVRPGLTGWAAVNGLRGDTSIEERAHFDNVYIDNWSLGFDLKVLLMTALAVVKGTGE